jgi:hypothetical protein
MEKGLAVFLALVALGLLVEAIPWVGSKVDAWTITTTRTMMPMVVGLAVWGFLLAGVVVVFILMLNG